MMRYQTTRFKDMAVALRELEPFIRDGKHLETGKPFEKFGDLRSRELLANWLICAAINSEDAGERMEFHTDPVGGDGIIVDTRSGETWPTEHVLIPMPRAGGVSDIEALIAQAVEAKQKKGGAAYASGKTLVAFRNSGGGEWKPNRAARKLPADDFGAVWVVGLYGVEDVAYTYAVSNLHFDNGPAPAWTIHIAKDFVSWQVTRVQ
jgi:hypothetical protein